MNREDFIKWLEGEIAETQGDIIDATDHESWSEMEQLEGYKRALQHVLTYAHGSRN